MLSTRDRLAGSGGRATVSRKLHSSSPLGRVRATGSAASRPRRKTLLSARSSAGRRLECSCRTSCARSTTASGLRRRRWTNARVVDERVPMCRQVVLAAVARGSEQVGGALGGVGLALHIETGRGGEPGGSLVGTAELGQRCRRRRTRAGPRRAGAAPVQSASGEHRQRGVGWPRSRRAPATTMNSSARVSGSRRPTSGSLSTRTAWAGPAQGTLAVGDDRQVAGIAGDPARGAQFGQRLGPFLRVVRGDSDRLADGGHREARAAGRAGMREGPCGIGVEQPARPRRDEPATASALTLLNERSSARTCAVQHRHVQAGGNRPARATRGRRSRRSPVAACAALVAGSAGRAASGRFGADSSRRRRPRSGALPALATPRVRRPGHGRRSEVRPRSAARPRSRGTATIGGATDGRTRDHGR